MEEYYVASIPIGFGLGRNAEQITFVPKRRYTAPILEQNPNPKPRHDPEILGIERVANILQCSIDKVRRISRTELQARRGPGKSLLYLRADVLNYVEGLPVTNKQQQSAEADDLNLSSSKFDIDGAMKYLTES